MGAPRGGRVSTLGQSSPLPQEQAGGWISSLQKVKDTLVTDGKGIVGCLLANVSLLHQAHFAR